MTERGRHGTGRVRPSRPRALAPRHARARRRSTSACSACSSPSRRSCSAFSILTGGKILQPANMVTLAVQAAGVAIIATGMVLIIVSRNIDLSVGSIVGVIAMTYALLMTDWLPNILGIGARQPVHAGSSPWPSGSSLGAAIGALQGFIIAYVGVPVVHRHPRRAAAFRGVVWYLSSGAAVAGLDTDLPAPRRRRRRARSAGTLTWVLGRRRLRRHHRLLINSRRQRRRFGFPVRPMWAEVLLGVVGCLRSLGVAAFANAYLWPQGLADRVAAEQNWASPSRRRLADPDRASRSRSSCCIGVTLVMTFIADPAPVRPLRLRLRRQPRRRRAGRHQHPLDDHEDVHPDGRPVRASPPRSRRPGSTARRSTSARATSCTSSPPRSSAGRRSPAASGRSRAPSSAPSSCSRCAYGLGFIGRQLARPEHRRRHRPRRRRRPRHLQPPARLVSGRRTDR